MPILLYLLIFFLISLGLRYYAKCLSSDDPSLLKTITEYFEAKSERKKEASGKKETNKVQTKMFKLAELSLGYFAIIEENDELSVMPVKVHGMMRVTYINKKYNTDLLMDVSKELLESGEIESLKREAIEQTEEAVADEFTD